MSKYFQQYFTPANPKKLIGNQKPFARSSWEYKIMQLLDQHPSVIQWASESIRIPYKNPFTGRPSQYVPDFLILYMDKIGKQHAELIEVKPKKEALLESAKSRRDKAALILNTAKWQAALAYAKKNGLIFRIITEDDIWINRGKK